jgi:gamma-glutamylcyclotransferase (GGCT)/AIG2-like uncharacterized protein YtfP
MPPVIRVPPTRLFVYGTLTFASVRAALAGRPLAGVPAVLPGWVALTVRGHVYPGAVPRSGSVLPGCVLTDVDEATLALLDAFEGPFYTRRLVEPRVGARTVPAWAWIVEGAHRAHLLEEPWDREDFAELELHAYRRRCLAFGTRWRRMHEPDHWD